MKIFSHRINTIDQLMPLPTQYGAELDLRSNGRDIYMHHDAFGEGELFSDWLNHYHHSGLILNTKCEGLESKLIEMMENHGIEDYFFLDLSLPFLVKTMNTGCKNIAVRYSEYEPMEFVRNFEGKVDWVWIDCFQGKPVESDVMEALNSKFKTCAVSPELQGYTPEKIGEFKAAWKGNMPFAVCTKMPDLWI